MKCCFKLGKLDKEKIVRHEAVFCPNDNLEKVKKTGSALFSTLPGCGISRTRTYDPHDVNVVL